MKSLKQIYEIDAPTKDVWLALTEPKIIEKWSGDTAVMSEEEFTEFSLWGGDIHGTNIEVIKNQRLIQDWYGGEWAEPSRVLFELSSEGSTTTVSLIQTNIPDEDFDDIEDGWDQFYLGAIKQLLEKDKED